MRKTYKIQLPSLSLLIFSFTMFMLCAPIMGQDISAALGIGIVLSSYLPMPQNVLSMNNTNNQSARATFEHARMMLFNAFIDDFIAKYGNNKEAVDKCNAWVNNRKLSQSELRLETTLTATANTFQFGVIEQQNNSAGVQFNTERRLKQQDSFVCSEYGIYIGQPDPEDNADTEWQLCSYPDTQIFQAADIVPLNTTFYSHGWLSINVNNDVIVPYRGLINHLYRPQTQQTAALGAASPQDQFRPAEDGLITEEPNIVFVGTKGNIPQINLPKNLSSAQANLRVIFMAKGILAQNSTVTS